MSDIFEKKYSPTGDNESWHKPFSVSNILGAVSKVKSALSQKPEGTYGLKDFLKNLNSMGVALKCRYEVTFEGLDNITFFISNISTPSVQQNFTELSYDGKKVEVPINYEYSHSFSMTILCDGEGVLYSTILNFIMGTDNESLMNAGYVMTIRVLGDGDNTDGILITLNGVRFKNVSGLDFSPSGSDIASFNVDCSCVSFKTSAGKVSTATGIIGGLGDVINVSNLKGRIGL